MWHAELGRSLPDMWTGKRHRGVQLHDLRAAVLQWGHRYGQRGWVRQLSGDLAPGARGRRCCARSPGWTARRSRRRQRWPGGGCAAGCRGCATRRTTSEASLTTAYCAEVVALTFVEMGLLPDDRRPSWYDPGRFWSGDDLDLAPGFALGGEIEVVVPPAPDRADAAPQAVSAPPRRWKRLLRR